MNRQAFERYHRQLSFSDRGGFWQIVDSTTPCKENDWQETVVFEIPYDENYKGDEPPPEIRAEYERLIEWKEGDSTGEPFNLVEALTAADEDGGHDQPCIYGNRVDGHAVYCHNTTWLYSPRKCRRTWYTDGEIRDEDCPGYKPNPQVRPNSTRNVRGT